MPREKSCEKRTQEQEKKSRDGCGRSGAADEVKPRLTVVLRLCVDGGHVAQAAVEAAHREENALLWAGRELAAALQLLRQAKAWMRRGK